MGLHIQNTKVRTTQRVRVTDRVMSKKDHRGRRVLLAREGEILSIREALARGIPEKHLEAVGPGGKAAFAALREAAKAKDDEAREAAIVEAERRAAAAERIAQQDSDAARADRIRGGTGEFPRRRGGENFELSDGSIFTGTAEEAQAAEAALSGPVDPSEGNMDEVMGRVGDDAERAAAALEAEKAKGDKKRDTLVAKLEAVIAAAENGGE